MRTEKIRQKLFSLQDVKYRDFQAKLMPNIDPDHIIGVRTPDLRRLAKEIAKDDPDLFLKALPHTCFEENQLHAFVVSGLKDLDRAYLETERFLPYIDNWATCDQFSPSVFSKDKTRLEKHVRKWISSTQTYTCRFGIVMLMRHFLDDDFKCEYLDLVVNIVSDEYYVNMARAWYFATALAKHYEETLPLIEKEGLDIWTHNKTIQKACESYRIDDEHKRYLKTLKRKMV